MITSPTKSFTYISSDQLYIVSSEPKEHQVHSEFAREMEENAKANQKRHSWKGSNEQFGAFDTWGSGKYKHWDDHKAKFVNATQGKDTDLLYYLLRLPNAVGLFKYNISTEGEHRSFHTNTVDISEITFHPDEDKIIASFTDREQSHIGLLASDSLDHDIITDGDVYDAAPSWDLICPDTIYYQSCGIGRNQDGHYAGVSPVIINRLNIKSGQHDTLLEHEAMDYLSPKSDKDGNLYYIQRPYGYSGLRQPWYKEMLNIILIPVRFVQGIFAIVDGLAKILGKKPMVMDGPNVERKEPDRWLNLKGSNIDLSKLKKDASNDGAVVPDTWKLMKLDTDGVQHVIASSVIEFDVSPDGAVLYSNGYKVYEIDKEKKKQIFKSPSIIDQLNWIG